MSVWELFLLWLSLRDNNRKQKTSTVVAFYCHVTNTVEWTLKPVFSIYLTEPVEQELEMNLAKYICHRNIKQISKYTEANSKELLLHYKWEK